MVNVGYLIEEKNSMTLKSERLKKLEQEQSDLIQWLKLGLVPKKDINKHNEEIQAVQARIEEEKERLRVLKETGDVEEYITPRRNINKPAYADNPTISDIDAVDEGLTDLAMDLDQDTVGMTNSVIEEDEDSNYEEKSTRPTVTEEDEEDPFSDRNRWRRGVFMDPDADDW